MFKKILVALDGSGTSNLALKEAIKLARDGNSKVLGIYVVDSYHVHPEVDLITPEDVISSMREEGKSILAQAQKKISSASVRGSVKLIETSSTSERIAEVIAKEANSWAADVIVVGTHGRRGFSHLILGSVAESIVRVASKPVLLIRNQSKR